MSVDDFQQFESAIARVYNKQGTVIGAGFLIAERYLLTCAHVIAAALGISDTSQTMPTEIIELDFPLDAAKREVMPQKLQAKVISWFPVLENNFNTTEDVAGLQLLNAPPSPIQPVKLQAVSNFQDNHPFKLFGFPKSDLKGAWVQMVSRGGLGNGWVQMEDERPKGIEFEKGFSGAPIWDVVSQSVVGIAVARVKNRPDVAFMMPKKSLFPALKALDFYSLKEILNPTATQHWKSIKNAYQICRSDGKLQQIVSSIEDVLTGLTDAPDGSTGFSAVLRFATCLLVDQDVKTSTQKLLRQWIEARTERIEDLLTWARQQFQAWNSRQQKIVESHLLVKVRPSSQKPDRYFVEAWLVPDLHEYDNQTGIGSESLSLPEGTEEPIAIDHLPALIRHFIDQSSQHEVKDLAIDVFLPLALLNHPVDTCIPPDDDSGFSVLLGSEHRVLVRTSDRLARNYPFRGNWKAKWESIQQNTQSACDVLQSLKSKNLNQQIPRLSRPEVTGLRLMTPPQAGKGSELYFARV